MILVALRDSIFIEGSSPTHFPLGQCSLIYSLVGKLFHQGTLTQKDLDRHSYMSSGEKLFCVADLNKGLLRHFGLRITFVGHAGPLVTTFCEKRTAGSSGRPSSGEAALCTHFGGEDAAASLDDASGAVDSDAVRLAALSSPTLAALSSPTLAALSSPTLAALSSPTRSGWRRCRVRRWRRCRVRR